MSGNAIWQVLFNCLKRATSTLLRYFIPTIHCLLWDCQALVKTKTHSLSYALPLLQSSNYTVKYDLLCFLTLTHRTVKRNNLKSNEVSQRQVYKPSIILLPKFMWSWHINVFSILNKIMLKQSIPKISSSQQDYLEITCWIYPSIMKYLQILKIKLERFHNWLYFTVFHFLYVLWLPWKTVSILPCWFWKLAIALWYIML